MAQFSKTNQPKGRGRKVGSKTKSTLLMEKYGDRFVDHVFNTALNSTDAKERIEYSRIAQKILPTTRQAMPLIKIAATGDPKKDALLIAQGVNKGEIAADVGQAALAVNRDATTLVQLEEIEALLDKLLTERGIK